MYSQLASLRGRVTDESGKPIPFARVVGIFPDDTRVDIRANEHGEFDLELKAVSPIKLQAFAPGYAPVIKDLIDPLEGVIELRLATSRLADSVIVTASRGELPMSRSTQSVVVVGRDQQEMTPSQTTDDMLRKVPGFTLFRRSSSLVANPTSQGVSLRGVGPSGASRSLVLADGVPLTDPFGGWVYWGRVPRISIDRIELLRGGASELYGTDALGGVIQLLRRSPTPDTVRLEGSWGSNATSDYSFYLSDRIGRHGVAFTGEVFRTDGYIQVSRTERGPVDVESNSRHHALEALWEFRPTPDSRVYAVASQFSERRSNGTPLQVNDTQIKSLAGGASFVTQGKNEWLFQASTLSETFDAAMSSVALNRRTEALTRTQRVPATSAGVQGSWRRLFGMKHLVLAGTDFAHVQGDSDELGFAAGALTGSVIAGGEQDRTGLFVQDLFQVTPALQLLYGIRWDTWRNHDASSLERTFATGTERRIAFPDQRQSAWSPKIGARFELNPDVAVRGSLSRSFRAPSLNELYRSFRVGNVLTGANPDLGPERATVGEIGLDWGLRSPISLRSTFFWYEIHGNVANVTLTSTPALITRQRQNLGTTRSLGLELDAEYHPNPYWTLGAGYFLSDATVRSAPKVPELVGLRIPQIPRHQGTIQGSYRREEWFFANVILRLSGNQYDDDQNVFSLGTYQIVDLAAGKSLTRMVELFFACENLFDRTYSVGRTPVETIGMPRRVHGGLRFRLE
jgi:outer membrane receptor protein involved in Fe transport